MNLKSLLHLVFILSITGLSLKLSVMFSFNSKKNNLPNLFEDIITVLGDDFK